MSPLPRLSVAIAVVALVGATLVVAQPSLTPPAGPIEESGRFGTLIELNQTNTPSNGEALFVISEPGSYVLTGDAEAGGLDGILIESDDVTIDLNGYTLRGRDAPGPSGVGTFGIAPTRPTNESLNFTNITVRNGSITGFAVGFISRNGDNSGQNPNVSNFESVRLERLNVIVDNFGILLTRTLGEAVVGGVIDSCVVRANDTGIEAENAVITDCQVVMGAEPDFGSTTGIEVQNTTVTGCSVRMDGELDKFDRAYRLFNATVTSSTSSGGGIGFVLASDSVANNCVANNPLGNADIFLGAQAFNSNF